MLLVIQIFSYLIYEKSTNVYLSIMLCVSEIVNTLIWELQLWKTKVY